MPFDTFGYNGALELTETLTNKLVAANAYERKLVKLDGVVVEKEEVLGPITFGLSSLYLLTGRPRITFRSHDEKNLIALSVPVLAVGLFTRARMGASFVRQEVQLPLGIGITIDQVGLKQDGDLMNVDFSGVEKKHIQFDSLTIRLDASGTGGQGDPVGIFTDATLDALLKPRGFTADALREQVVEQLKTGKIGGVQISVASGGKESPFRKWDLRLFDGQDRGEGNGGVLLLLYAVEEITQRVTGRGLIKEPEHIIPTRSRPPEYGFGISLGATVLSDMIDAALGAYPYWHQTNNVRNEPDGEKRYGYLVVPPKGNLTFCVPSSAADQITVNAPKNGEVTVTAAAGSLPAGARLRLTNKDRVADGSVTFDADDKGAGSTSIRATAGNRLAMAVEAIRSPEDKNLLTWRPTISLEAGKLRAKSHYKYFSDFWCDLEGEAEIEIGVNADPGKPFRLDPYVIHTNLDLPLSLALTGGAAKAMWLAPLGPAFWFAFPAAKEGIASWVQPKLQPVVQGQFDKLNKDLLAAIPSGFPLFLEQVDISTDGVMLSGFAEADSRRVADGEGLILAFDRALVSINAGTASLYQGDVSLQFTWAPGTTLSLSAANRVAVVGEGSEYDFWAESMDDVPLDGQFGRSAVPLSRGGNTFVWYEFPAGYAKVLIRWLRSEQQPDDQLQFTWIACRRRLTPSIRIENGVKSEVLSVTASKSVLGTITKKLVRWEGIVEPETTKFFLTPETKSAGLEEWYVDGEKLTPGGTKAITFDGGRIDIESDPDKHGLRIHLDQSGLPDLAVVRSTFELRFKATDVFGRTREAQLLVSYPPVVVDVDFIPGFPNWGPFPIDPLGGDDPRRPGMREPIASMMTAAARSQVSAVLGQALQNGTAILDASTAAEIAQLIGRGRFNR